QRTGYCTTPVGLPADVPVWQATLGGPIVSSPSISGGTVYIGCRDSTLYAFNAASGAMSWKKKTAGWVDASPLVSYGTVVTGSRDGALYILDAKTGSELSQIPAGVQLSSAARTPNGHLLTGLGPPLNGFSLLDPTGMRDPWSVYFTQMSYSSPALQGLWAVIGADDGRLYGMNLAEKKVAWTVQTDGGVYLSSPAIVDSVVYFAPGDYDRNIYAVNLPTGTIRWQMTGTGGLAKNAGQQAPATDPALLTELRRMKPSQRARMAAYLAEKGVAWAGPLSLPLKKSAAVEFLPSGDAIRTSSVAVDSSRVYVIRKEGGYSNDNAMTPLSRFTLLALDAASGMRQWSMSEITSAVPLGYCSSPIVAADKVVFGWGDGHLFMLEAATGKTLWRDTVQGHIISSPAVADVRLYVATMEGNLYCYALDRTLDAENFKEGTFCYPNPARKGVAHIQVYVTRTATMEMTIYSVAERPVLYEKRALAADEKYTYDWNLGSVANGIYFARIVVKYNDGGTEKKVLKIAVLK
ncbi:MAG: PQQ-binding-like beta-propeller repeat protein, partial [Chitinispirillaceae bacterium]|nr:PQQ-binding-like beta-propeller repeat protein [Chitinispirillaceae bacterium]